MGRHAISILFALVVSLEGNERVPGFNQDIRPILSSKCIQCHGPDAGDDGRKRKGNLRLDVADGDQGAYRIDDGSQAIKPGDPEGSEVWRRITHQDPEEVMPPLDAHVKPLTANERELIRKWILAGAEYEEFWAFVPPRDHEVPEVREENWSDQPVDRFVLSKIEEKGLKPSPKADKRTLIRRLSFDLTGLPPTPEEIEVFLGDDSEEAHERLVDRLLARPQYGEHMAKYWLDLVRFADTNGMHHDHYREATPYRDWVIRSYNENLPFDDFIKYQIAGDLYPEPTNDQLIASGFNRLHLIIDAGTALPEESFTKNVIDRVSAVGTAFMGLTLQCAVCHDHKYDPITQKDFYQMYAFFNNFDGGPETGGRRGPDFKRGLQVPYLSLPSPQQKLETKRLEGEVARLAAELKSAREAFAKDSEEVKAAAKRHEDLKKELNRFLEGVPATLVMKERADERPAHILIRGVYDNPGEKVERDTPGFLPRMAKEGKRNRMDLAEWMVDPGNPLSARVAVNRIWQQFFGVGLVKTSEDFGAQGEWPSHPRLLDFLSVRFVESGWDVKGLVRSMVLSETYLQSSTAEEERFKVDPENRLLARGSRFRLDSEMIRDQVLAISGLLNPQMYGKSVKPPQPDGLWKIVSMPSSYPNTFRADEGDQIYRRSIYTFWKRGLPPPQMSIFDAPTRESCIARRERTNTPLQALLLMNEEQFFAAAMHSAKSLLEGGEAGDEERIRGAYERVTSREPSGATVSQLKEALGQFMALYSADPDSARAMLAASPDPEIRAVKEPAEQVGLASWTMLVHSLLNLDITKTRE